MNQLKEEILWSQTGDWEYRYKPNIGIRPFLLGGRVAQWGGPPLFPVQWLMLDLHDELARFGWPPR